MTFSIVQLMERRKTEQYSLHRQYINPSLARVQTIIGFDKIYVRGEGSYLWDADGNRYLDLLSGYGVFNLGRSHPVVKQAIQDVLTVDRPNLVKMDCPLLAGLLAEELVKRMPAGLVFRRTGYAVSHLLITRTDSGGRSFNFSEIVGNGAGAGVSNLYYPAQERTWTKTGQKWLTQVAIDGIFNVFKEFWPDIHHAVFRGQY